MYFGRRRVCTVPVVRVEDDPNDPDRVIVTDGGRNRANMTIRSYYATCRLAVGAEVLSTRLFGWDW
jgi:hypothetical protein